MDEVKQLKKGQRIKWQTLTRELHGIVIRFIPSGYPKRISRAELIALANNGIIPKVGIQAKRTFSEGRARGNRYMVLRFSFGLKHSFKVNLVTISENKEVEESQYMLNTEWVQYMKGKRYRALKAVKKKKGLR